MIVFVPVKTVVKRWRGWHGNSWEGFWHWWSIPV